MRVTPHRQLELGQYFSQRHLQDHTQLQTQITSGIRVHRPSDDPRAQKLILNQQTLVQRFETQSLAIDEGRAILNNVHTQTREAQQLVVQAKNVLLQAQQSNNESEAKVFAQEINAILESLNVIANSKHEDVYLFAGERVRQQPYGDLTESTAYLGSAASGSRELAGLGRITTHYAGPELFSTGNAGIDLFQTLRDTADHLNQFDTIESESWHQGVTDSIDDLETMNDHLLEFIGEQGVTLQGLDRLQSRTEGLQLEAVTILSEIQATDFAEAAIQLQETQNMNQYALATLAGVFQVSVLDFLR